MPEIDNGISPWARGRIGSSVGRAISATHAWPLMLCLPAAIACTEILPEPPRLNSVSPSQVAEGVLTTLTLEGLFRVGFSISYDDEARSTLDTEFTVTVGDRTLADVSYVDPSTLTAQLPADLPVGVFDVTVTDPRMQYASLTDSLTVTAQQTGCISDVDCRDACHTTATCIAGSCQGGADKDSDADGAVDIACSGGTDCDDDPTACGAQCRPGLVEICDGFDNDCDGNTDTGSAMSDWWDAGWSARRKLTFDNSGQTETLDSFVALVTLDASWFDYSTTDTNGIDLRFIDDDGSTVLAHHIESWNPAGKSFVWVRVLTIDASSSTDFISMYYGNTGASDTQDEGGTYDASYAGVWHLHESSGGHIDSATGINCVAEQGVIQGTVGYIDGAATFDGQDDRIHCGTDQMVDTTDHTITAWVNMSLTGTAEQLVVDVEELDPAPYSGLALYVQRRNGAIGRWYNNRYVWATLAENQVAADTWAFIAIRGHNAVAGWLDVSVNGGAWERIISGDTRNYLGIKAGTPLVIGRWMGGGGNPATTGSIDEVQIHNVVRSEDWVRAQYLSTNGGFVTFGSPEIACP